MGFNKRIFSTEMLLQFFSEDRENGIKRAIGKTEGFIFHDETSQRVINLWMEGKNKEAVEILEKVEKERKCT